MTEKRKRKLFRNVLIVLTMVAPVAFSGCQSLAGTFGIATEQYVEDKMNEAGSRLSSRIDENQSRLDEYAATADKLEQLISSVENAVRTTDELKQLAVVLEDRLDSLPEETIRQLVEVLQRYLDEQ